MPPKKKKRSRAEALVVLLFCAPIALFAGRETASYADALFWRAGMLPSHDIVEAEVVHKERITRRASRPEQLLLTWAWVDEEGEHQDLQPVAASTYDRTDIGDSITVLVDEGGQSIISGWKDNGERLFYDAAITGVLGLLTLVFGLAGLGGIKRLFSGRAPPSRGGS
ncbi:MAG TPA: hypothetical protein QGF58_03175 [Myxococcota bacterium]|nr:hypothetical protein [Myxococcota bacterium]